MSETTRAQSSEIFDLRPTRTPESVIDIASGQLAGHYERYGGVWFTVSDISVTNIGGDLHHGLTHMESLTQERDALRNTLEQIRDAKQYWAMRPTSYDTDRVSEILADALP